MAAVDAFRLTFMKIDKDHLDPNDNYDSEWVGGGARCHPSLSAATASRPSASSATRTRTAQVRADLRPVMPAIGSRFPDFEAASVGTENQPSTPFPPKTNMTVAAGVVRYGIIGADVGQKNARI